MLSSRWSISERLENAYSIDSSWHCSQPWISKVNLRAFSLKCKASDENFYPSSSRWEPTLLSQIVMNTPVLLLLGTFSCTCFCAHSFAHFVMYVPVCTRLCSLPCAYVVMCAPIHTLLFALWCAGCYVRSCAHAVMYVPARAVIYTPVRTLSCILLCARCYVRSCARIVMCAPVRALLCMLTSVRCCFLSCVHYFVEKVKCYASQLWNSLNDGYLLFKVAMVLFSW